MSCVRSVTPVVLVLVVFLATGPQGAAREALAGLLEEGCRDEEPT